MPSPTKLGHEVTGVGPILWRGLTVSSPPPRLTSGFWPAGDTPPPKPLHGKSAFNGHHRGQQKSDLERNRDRVGDTCPSRRSGAQRVTHRRQGPACPEASRSHARNVDSGSPTEQAVAGVRVAGSAGCPEPPFIEEHHMGTVLPLQGLPAHPSTPSSCLAPWQWQWAREGASPADPSRGICFSGWGSRALGRPGVGVPLTHEVSLGVCSRSWGPFNGAPGSFYLQGTTQSWAGSTHS